MNNLLAATSADAIAHVAVAIVFLVVFAVGGIAAAISSRRRAKALKLRADLMYTRYTDWLRAIQANGGTVPTVELPVILQDGEEGLYQDSAQLLEPRSVRISRHGGSAIRIAKGVTIGQGRTRSESHEEWRQIAAGYLYITTHRLIFDGDMQSRNIKLSDIVSIDYDANNLQVATAKRQKPMIFTSVNGYIANAILRSAVNNHTTPKT